MENLFLESMIEKIIHSLQTLEGTVVEKDKSYDVSMRDWAWPQGVALLQCINTMRRSGTRRF